MLHASACAVNLHYLKAVAALGVVEAKASGRRAVGQMKAMPTDDDVFDARAIRADGRGLFPAYLFEVKPPAVRK
jgi:branched-chain amino acid transport system substrate-binding protein